MGRGFDALRWPPAPAPTLPPLSAPLTPPRPPPPVRKANIDAAERAMWEEELALHTVDTGVAEAAVLRQREVDWKYRSDLAGHARAMMTQLYPFVATLPAAK